MLFTIYETRTLVLLAPALLFFELCLMLLSLSKGITTMHLHALRQAVAEAGSIASQRARVQETRMVSDLNLLEAAPLISTGTLAESRRVAMASAMLQGVFNSYWRLVSRQLEP